VDAAKPLVTYESRLGSAVWVTKVKAGVPRRQFDEGLLGEGIGTWDDFENA
jgi:hypothetical protein